MSADGTQTDARPNRGASATAKATGAPRPLASGSPIRVGAGSRVVVLCGSPFASGRCARTAAHVVRFLEGAGAVVDLLDIASANVSPCIGCNRCKALGRCFMRDGMDGATDALLFADALLVVSPVYFSGPPSQLKALLDRMQPLFWSHVNGRLRKPMALVAFGEGGDPYGHAALDSCVASAMSMAGYRLVKVLECVGESAEDAESRCEGLFAVGGGRPEEEGDDAR